METKTTHRRRRAAGAALVLAVLATGCGKAAPSSDGGSKGGDKSAAAPIASAQVAYTTKAATGDIDAFSWNLPNGEPSSLDPIKSYGNSNNSVLANLCESVLRQNPDFSLTPALASKYDQTDPTTLVYTIRSGVKFWDGKPLTAEDVAYSLSRNLDAKLGSFWASPFFNNVTSIKATGPDQVTVKLKREDALFNRMMATAAGVIGEKAYIESKGAKYGTPNGGLSCTGPYKLDRWQAGSQITMTKNPDYWDQSLKPKAGKVTFRFITDESTATSALTSGEIDGSFQVATPAIPQLSSSGTGKLTFGADTEFMGFRPTEKKGLFQDKRIRQALSLAVNRDEIAKVVFQGSGTPSVSPIQPAAWGYGKDVFKKAFDKLPRPKYDLAAAKKLVKEAGSPKTPIVVAAPSDVRSYVQTLQTLQSAAKQIGLNMKIKTLPSTTFVNLYFDKKARAPYDLFLVVEYGAGVAEPIVALSEFTPDSVYNYGNNDIPAITQSLRSALATSDDDKRAEYVAKAQAALVDNAIEVNVLSLYNTVFQSKRITGAVASLSYLYYPWAAAVGAP